MAYNMTCWSGPSGAVVAAIGAGAAFAINAASIAVVAIVLGLMQLPGDTGSRRRHSVGVRRGLSRLALSYRPGRGGLGCGLHLAAPLEQLMPGVARKHSDSALAVGVLLGAMGLVRMMANPFLSRRLHDAGTSSRALATGLPHRDSRGPVHVLAMSPATSQWTSARVDGYRSRVGVRVVSGQSTLAIDIPDETSKAA